MPDITIQELDLTDYITSNDYMFLDRGNKTYKIKPSNLGGFNAENIIYVATNGDDITNSGLSPSAPLKTLKKACSYASNNTAKKYSILLSSGTYYEENPIVVPKYTSIIGDNIKNVIIIPNNKQYDVLWLNDLCYLYGIKITNQLKPAFAISFPQLDNTTNQYDIAYNSLDLQVPIPTKELNITFGPYIDECEINTRGFTLPLQNQAPQVIHPYSYDTQSLGWVNSLYSNITSIILQQENNYDLIFPRVANPVVAYDDAYAYFNSIKSNYENNNDFYNINATLTSFGVDVITTSLSTGFFRDVSFILNALAYDINSNSNRLATEVGRNYFYNLSSLILPYSGYNSKNAVLSGLDHLYYKIKTEVFPGVPMPYSTGTVASFVTKEFEYLKETVSNLKTIYYPVTSAPTNFVNTAYAISSNKNFLIEETYAYLNYNYFGSLDETISTNFKTDLNLFIDNTISDLISGTNVRTIQNAFVFYSKIKNILPKQDIIYADTFKQLFDLSTSIIKNQSISALSVECGNGIKIDGSLVSGFSRNMTIDSTEHTIQGGTGVYVTNNGNARLYNIKTLCCNESVLCDNGGVAIIDGSHSTYGLSGLVATGVSPTPVLTATTNGTFTISDSSIDIASITPIKIGSYDAIVRVPYVGLRAEFRINNNTLSSVYLPIDITPLNNGGTSKLYFNSNIPKTIPNNTPVYFSIRSTIKANYHTFENIGTGNSYLNGNLAIGNNSVKYQNQIVHDTTPSNPKGYILYSTLSDGLEYNINNILKVSTNSILTSGTQVIQANSTEDALRIIQTGSGNCFVVEDSQYIDSSLFIIKNDGYVGIGTTTPNEKLTIVGNISSSNDIYATNLNLSGNGLIKNNLTIYGGISAVKDITATNLNLSGSGLVASNLTVYGGISAVKDITATNLNLSGNGLIRNDLTVYGGISAVKDITATNLNLSGNGLIRNDLTIYGGISAVKDITANSLNLSGNGLIRNDLTIYGGISAVKDITATNLNLSGNGLIKNNLTIYGGISAVKDITATNLNLSGSGLVASNLTVYGGISAVKDITATNLNLSGSGLVASNLTVYGGISAVKDITATNLFLSGDAYIKATLSANKANINDLTVFGNLSVLGNSTQLDTIINTTSALEIQSFGVGPALKITQYGFQPIAHFIDSNGDDIMFADNGYVGLGVDTPNEKLTVIGNISSNATIFALSGNSNNWNSVYNSTISTSANWDSVFSSVKSVSGIWNSVYSSVVPVSGNWNSVYTSTKDTSGNWNSVFSSVRPVSGNWNSVYSSVVPVSSNWNSVYSSVVPVSSNWDSVYSSNVATSGNWDSVYSSNVATSGNWDSVYSSSVATSGNWDSVYSSVESTSASWDSVYNSVVPVSSNWDSVYSSVESTSASWDSVYNSVVPVSSNWDSVYSSNVATSGNWDSVYSSVVPVSSNWNSVYSSVVPVSGNWNSVYTSTKDTSGNWNSVFSSVRPVSGNWNSVYSSVLANSATYATITFTDTKYFPISGGVITGNTRFNKDITVYGNISATGNSYFANTIYSTTSALSVININNDGPALYVSNNGTGDLASFYDVDSNVEQLHIGGYNGSYPNVGVKTSTPNKDLTVKGEISASGDVWTSGRLLSGGFELLSLITPKTNEIYNTVQSNSAITWNYQGTDVKSLSSNWQTAYVYVQANSAITWNYQGTDVKAISSNWQETYTNFRTQSADNLSVFSTVLNNSASNWNWNYQGNDLKALSANWDNTYTNFRTQSANNLSVVSTVLANSATTWNYQGNDVKALSANWQNTYTNFRTQSANNLSVVSTVLSNSATTWNYQGNDVKALSANWQSVYGSVLSVSSDWNTGFNYSTVYNQNSSTYATINFANNKFLPLSGGVITGDLTIQGNVSTLGSTTQIDTMLFVTSAVSIINHGSGPALLVTQNGSEDIVNVYDDSNLAFTVKDGGNVGININNPNEKLTVNGNISSNAIIYDSVGNSNQWNDIYTSVSSASSIWNDTSTSTQNISGDWNSVYSSTKATSGDWNSVYSSVVSVSSNWDSVYSSSVATSGNWDSVYSTYQSNSSSLVDYTHLSNNYLPLSGGTLTGELDVIIDSNATSTLFVSGNRVGINTETPTDNLTVIGDIKVSGLYKFNSTTTPPTDTINPVSWVNVVVGSTTYKMPLYL